MGFKDFIRDYYYGFNLIKGVNEVFELDDYQHEFFDLIENNQFAIIRKSRQMHATHMLAAYYAWQLLTNKDDCKVFLYFSNKFALSTRFVKRVKTILRHYCEVNKLDLNDMTRTNNSRDLHLYNGNRLFVCASEVRSLDRLHNVHHIRFDTIRAVVFDEGAFIYQMDSLVEYLERYMDKESQIIIASTPNGMEYFHYIYEGSINSTNPYVSLYLPCTVSSKYNDEWYKNMCCAFNNDSRKIRQELHAEFLQSPIKYTKPAKDKVVQVRIHNSVYDMLGERLLALDMSQSDYLRDLIAKDLTQSSSVK